MLNPIDTDRVIRDGQVSGRFPGEIHEGVAWWVAACFVVTNKTSDIAVARDEHPTTAEFHRRFCRGAINAHHWACQVADIGAASEEQLTQAMSALGGVPGALLTTTAVRDVETVTMRLYAADGTQLDDRTGLSAIREMIAADLVPIPVNDRAKGRVHDRRDLVSPMTEAV
jgi:hypothetical protein